MSLPPPFKNWIGPGGVGEVVLRFRGPDQWPTMQFVLGTGGAFPRPSPSTFTDAILANFQTELMACISSDYILSGVVFNFWNSGTLTAHIEVPYAIPGSVSSPSLPAAFAACFVKRNSSVHLQPWPRTYLPGIPEAHCTNSRWTTSALAALEACRAKLWHIWDFGNEGWGHAIPHWNTGTFTAISTTHLVSRVCYLHRRRSRGSRSMREFNYPQVW